MTFKRGFRACVAFCIMAILVIAMCGCDDLGAYESTEEYYATFGDIVFLGGVAEGGEEYSVEDYFYNEDSREDFLSGENGEYNGVPHSDYVYVAIPLETDLHMDSLAMYLQANSDVTVYINVYVTDKLPTNWKTIGEIDADGEDASSGTLEDTSGEGDSQPSDGESEEPSYDDPIPETRIGEITVTLKGGKWNSFTLDSFTVNGNREKSIRLNEDYYILLQIRNNSGVRDFDEETGLFVDPQTGLSLEKAEITMTNLLVRAVE